MAEATDGELVVLARGGDREAYGHLVARYQGHVYALAYSLVDNWAEAQDIAQETFIRAYVNLEGLRDPDRFPAWLRRVTFSMAMKWLKTYRPGLFQQLDGRIDLDTLDIPDFRPGPPEVVARRELSEAVQRAIAELPAKYRMPLTMFHLDGLSYQKVADFLDIPIGTAKSLIHRARAKLRVALADYVSEEVVPMVQDIFNEHRLPEEFGRRVLENVPTLGWGTGRECTFAGALEAALSTTEHPHTYTDILGLTGLAFRTRWFCGNERSRWCPSCAVGEMDEEIAAVAKTTGWPLRVHFLQPDDETNVAQTTDGIVESIDEGRPVLAYEPQLNMDVVYGYEERGKVLLLRDYSQGEKPLRLAPSKLGFMIVFIGDHGEAMSRREAVLDSLRSAVHNWRRVRAHAGPGEYWYGKAALEHWPADMREADRLSQDDRETLRFVNWWNFRSMVDARKAAVTYLTESADVLGGEVGEALCRTAELYAKEVELLDRAAQEPEVFGKSVEGWSADVRGREQEVLSQAIELEERAITAIEMALALV